MSKLTFFKDQNPNFTMMQNSWSRDINPVISNPLNNALILKNIILTSGTNTVNHLLGQTQQGWMIVDIQGPATIYRNAPFNNLTLSLYSSADVTVSIGVY